MDVSNDPLKRALPYEPFHADGKEIKNDEVLAAFEAAIPPSISNYVPPKEPITGKLLDEEVKKLETQQKDLLNLVEKAEALDFTQINGMQEVVEKVAQEQIRKVLDKNLENSQQIVGKEQKSQNITENLVPIEAGLDIGITNTPLQFDPSMAEPLEPMVIEEAFAKYFPELEISLVGANILSRGCVTLASGMVLNKIEEVIKAKERSLEHMEEGEQKEIVKNEVIVLKKWLAVQMDLFNDLLLDTTIMSATTLPKAAGAIVALIESSTRVATDAAIAAGNASLASSGAAALSTISTAVCAIDIIGVGATLIRSSLALKEAHDDKKIHKQWASNLVNKGDLSDVQKILNVQEGIYRSRLESNKVILQDLLSSMKVDLEAAQILPPENHVSVITSIQMQLKEAGIEIPFESPTIVQLQTHLMDPQNFNSFNDMMVKKKEMLSVSIRNGLRAFSNKKAEIDKGFLSLALTKAGAIFTTAVIVSIAIIVLKILVLAGVLASSAALSATGFGVLAVIVLFLIIGIAYLYWKKPNIFMTYINGVQAKLLYWSLPLAVQKYRQNYSVLETKKVSENINELGLRVLEVEKLLDNGTEKEIKQFSKKNTWDLSRIIPGYKDSKTIEDHREILIKYKSDLQIQKESKEKEAKALEDHVAYLNGSVEYFDAKVQKMQNKVELAGWKDFQRSLKKKDTPVKSQEEDYEILADFIMSDETLLEDSETRRLLILMGIDLKQLQSMDKKELKKEVGHLIRGFFAMETEDTVKLLNKQALLQKHGIVEKIEHPMSPEAQRKFEEQRKLQEGTNGIRENTALA